MKKSNIILIITGILLIIIPLLINYYSIFRLLSLLTGVIVILLGLIIHTKKKLIKIIFFPLIAMVFVYYIDFFNFLTFKTIPVISISYKSSSKVINYHSLFYQVYSCDGILTLDKGYKEAYLCKDEYLKTIPINQFMENPKTSFKKYNNKFVHLKGKINTIVGNTSLSLNTYGEEVSLNGYAEFDTGKKVVVEDLNLDPKNYYIYDIVEVIGKVSSYKEEKDVIYITLKKAKIIKSSLYDEYELVVNNNLKKDKEKAEDKIYYLGISSIYYKYDENNIYELDYLLLDKREFIDNLIKDVLPVEDEEGSKLYELPEYKLMVCKNENIIFINSAINKYNNICETKEDSGN